MKCFEIVDHKIVPGFPVKTGSKINPQTYVSLAAGGGQDGLKVFLTRELIDLLQEDRSNLRRANLALPWSCSMKIWKSSRGQVIV
jgi:hypothetical protein